MIKELVFIPITRGELAAIDDSVLLTDRAVYHVTPEPLAALEYTVGQEEGARHTVLVPVSVAVLTRFGERLMLVADVDTSLTASGDDPENGACVLTRAAPGTMTRWFSEAPGVDVFTVVIAVRGPDADTVWGFDGARGPLHESDLLWDDVEEHRRGLR